MNLVAMAVTVTVLAFTVLLASCASYQDQVIVNVRPFDDGSVELTVCTMQFGGQQVDHCRKVRHWQEPVPRCP